MNHRFYKKIVLLFLTVNLLGCAGYQAEDFLDFFQRDQVKIAYKKADRLVANDKTEEAVELLWQTARQLQAPQQQKMQIYAAEIMLDQQYFLDGYRLLNQIDESVIQDNLLLRKRFAQARFYHFSLQYQNVIDALPNALVEQGKKPLKRKVLQLLVNTHIQSNNITEGIRSELKLGRIAETAYRTSNTLTLWRLATSIEPKTAEAMLDEETDDKVKAWLSLAMIATPSTIDWARLEKAFADWQNKHSEWKLPPAIATEIHSRWTYLDFSPQRVAVLLPLTGTYSQYGKAVRSGMYFAANRLEKEIFKMDFYNTDFAKDESIAGIYQKAAREGADFIIGPLLKDNVDALQATTETSIPILTLNYTDTISPQRQRELFQFGLLPEDEAIQIAERLIQDKHYFTVAFAPDSPWGYRLMQTFTNHYTHLGGVIRDTVHYEKDIVDFSPIIEEVFGLADSYTRRQKLGNAIGYMPEFVPHPRDDIQSIVLFADEKYAHLIYPQMRYHHLDKLPVYATAHVYTPGKSIRNRDLDKLIYADAPAVISFDADEFEGVKDFDPTQLRLFALGFDAYHLPYEIRKMNLTHAMYPGMTGTLLIQSHKRLFRKLVWAQFRKDKPIPLN